MQRTTAEGLSKQLEQAMRSMSEAIAIVVAELPADEAGRMKNAFAIPLGRLSLVLDVIYDEYPDLTPPNLR
jgi:hypothetical protein